MIATWSVVSVPPEGHAGAVLISCDRCHRRLGHPLFALCRDPRQLWDYLATHRCREADAGPETLQVVAE